MMTNFILWILGVELAIIILIMVKKKELPEKISAEKMSELNRYYHYNTLKAQEQLQWIRTIQDELQKLNMANSKDNSKIIEELIKIETVLRKTYGIFLEDKLTEQTVIQEKPSPEKIKEMLEYEERLRKELRTRSSKRKSTPRY